MNDVVKVKCAYCGSESVGNLCERCQRSFEAGVLDYCRSCGEYRKWADMITTNTEACMCGNCQADIALEWYERKEVRKSLFSLGRTGATPGALEELEKAKTTPDDLFARHVRGDWGDLSKEDKAENELSLKEGFRIFSAYKLSTGVKVWVITEADRSATTILLPSEY
jgi:hypothetical protein